MESGGKQVSVDVSQTAATYESLIASERADNTPVFADEDGFYGNKSKYALQKKYIPKISFRHFSLPFRRRELLVLTVGCVLMCVALVLIITGVIRVHGCNCSVFGKCYTGNGSTFSSGDIHLVPIKNLWNLTQAAGLLDFNYALEKPTEQSSTDESTDSMEGDASYAIDGDINTCSRTDVEHKPSWQVDLKKIRPIRKIILLGKNGPFALHKFDVYIGSSANITENKLCQHHHSVTLTSQATVFCSKNSSGRYIGIMLTAETPDETKSLVLCEVIVYQK